MRPASSRTWLDALSGGVQESRSHPFPSMRDEGVQYRHPEREEAAMVWAQDAASIAAVLTYHYRDSWSHLQVLTA